MSRPPPRPGDSNGLATSARGVAYGLNRLDGLSRRASPAEGLGSTAVVTTSSSRIVDDDGAPPAKIRLLCRPPRHPVARQSKLKFDRTPSQRCIWDSG